jgi:hypothetical protein
MADKIQIRRDTAANWTSSNPTLAAGELGYETDTDKIKMGDGSTAWAAPLSYWGYATLDLIGDVTITSNSSGEILKWSGSAWINQTLAEAGIQPAPSEGAFANGDKTKLDAIEASATADQSNAEIRAAVEAATDSNVFTDADHTKLNAIEASADVTDATNVTAAGALMDSEVTNLADVKAFAFGSTVQAYDADTLKADTSDTLTAGFDSDEQDLGTISSGTTTLEVDGANEENFKKCVNGGAFILSPPSTSSSCVIVLRVTNNGSAGAITFTGFTVQDGDDLTTTNGHDFFITVIECGGFSSATVKALQ